MMVGVDIALATYNGERFLQTQLDSIAGQSHRDWTLHVADDGSTDATLAILEQFRAEHPRQVRVHHFDTPVRSAKTNFTRLLRRLPRPGRYVAPCDQDDEWDHTKLERLLLRCRALEGEGPERPPCLVFSDLAVVDADLALLSRSFMTQISIVPDRLTFGQLLVENSIPGSSMLFNSELLSHFQRFRGSLDHALMHDWWLALLAFGCGRVGFLPEQLGRYRQHDGNVAGSVQRSGLAFMLRKLRDLRLAPYKATQRQARLLKHAYGDVIAPENRAALDAYCSLEGRAKSARVGLCLKNGILKQSAARRVQQLLAI